LTADRPPHIVIYTRAFCGYCAAARSLLEKKHVEYEDIDVTMDAGLRREIFKRSGQTTLPQIFIGDRHIGGYDELNKLDRDGKLDPLLG
jgi:glutaredoxin 3